MAPPRRVRDEALTLRRTGSPDIELFRAKESIYLGQYPTQGRFQVASNAQFLAYTIPRKNTLTVVRRDGRVAQFASVVEDRFRISPDNKWLFVGRSYDGRFGISRIDLNSVQITSHEHFHSAIWLEFCADGLMVLEYVYESSGTKCKLSLMPWRGEAQVVANIDGYPRRFACAKAGSAFAYFEQGKVWSVAKPGAAPVLLADLAYTVENAEMSPDGRSLVVLTYKDAHVFQDGKLVQTLGIPNAHTVWFSPDGSQFLVANESKVHWQRGEKTVRLDADKASPIRTARFAPMSPWIMVARGSDVIRWNPEGNDAEVIASADDGQEMLAADVFAGGVAIWTGSPWQIQKVGEIVL
jgi:dipeptidyl aminopeptidase/acylaminoacyl peptidase